MARSKSEPLPMSPTERRRLLRTLDAARRAPISEPGLARPEVIECLRSQGWDNSHLAPYHSAASRAPDASALPMPSFYRAKTNIDPKPPQANEDRTQSAPPRVEADPIPKPAPPCQRWYGESEPALAKIDWTSKPKVEGAPGGS